MIDQPTINRIMDAANIVDVVSEYVTLRRSGTSYKGLCPFHDDKTPSFYVNPARGICKCFSCGKGGNVVHFIMEQEQLSYYEALRFLGKKYGIEVQERQLTQEERRSQSERESMFAVNEWASNYFHDTLLKTEDGRAAGLAYFRNRGFRDDIVEKFRLGYSLDQWDAMTKAAKQKGYKEDYLVKTGLAYRRDNGQVNDKYRGRVMFPWFSVSGKIVAFGGRVLDTRTKGVSQKYINSPESEIFHKSQELYGIFQAKKQMVKEDLVYMVEGYTDVISMHQCGVENVVANSGTALNEAQIRLIHRFTANITLLYDGDEAGIHAALRGTDMLLADGMNVKVLLLPDGDDPDSFARKHNATEFRQYVESHQTDFILFKVNLLLKEAGRDPRKRSELASNILKSISVIPDEIVRSSYIHECSELMNMDEQMLLRQCRKMRNEYIQQKKQEREREEQRKQNQEQQRTQIPVHIPERPDIVSNGRPTPINEDHIPPFQDTSNERPPELPSDFPPIDGTAIVSTGAPDDVLLPDVPPPDTPPADTPPADFPGEDSLPTDISETDTPATGATSADTSDTFLQSSPRSRADQRFLGLERLIMTFVVRYGENAMESVDAEGNNIQTTVVQYVNDELTIDRLQFHSPLYAHMLDEAVMHVSDPDFSSSRFFLNSPDVNVSREASDLLSDRYQLSKKQQMTPERERLEEYVPHLLLDYKYNVVKEELQRLSRLLADPEVLKDSQRCMEVMQQHVRMSSVIRKLARELGDRIIVK